MTEELTEAQRLFLREEQKRENKRERQRQEATDNPDRTASASAAHRESLLPCSGSAGQPLAPKEPFTPRTEVERLCREDPEVYRMRKARQELGL